MGSNELPTAPPEVWKLHSKLLTLMRSAIKEAKQKPFTTMRSGNARMRYFKEVRRFLKENPTLLTDYYSDVTPPLLYAARKLSPELAAICVRYGADPKKEYPFPGDKYKKNFSLAAAHAYVGKVNKYRNCQAKIDEYDRIYHATISPARRKSQF